MGARRRDIFEPSEDQITAAVVEHHGPGGRGEVMSGGYRATGGISGDHGSVAIVSSAALAPGILTW